MASLLPASWVCAANGVFDFQDKRRAGLQLVLLLSDQEREKMQHAISGIIKFMQFDLYAGWSLWDLFTAAFILFMMVAVVNFFMDKAGA